MHPLFVPSLTVVCDVADLKTVYQSRSPDHGFVGQQPFFYLRTLTFFFEQHVSRQVIGLLPKSQR